MAINKKLIHFKLKSSFETELANNNLLDTSIVFIQETKEIWTHGQLYKCSDPDLSNYVKESELQELLSPIQSSLANKLEASDLAGYAKTSDIPAAVTDSTVSNWGFMKTSDANETYAPKSLIETVSNQATTISTLATKDELSTGLADKLDNSAASNFVPTTRTINGTALTDDIWITATDPNAATKEEFNGLATTVANKAEVSALANFATTDALSSGLSGKQETLVSGTNIKTIEGKSILGSGDIQITAAEVGAYTTGQVDEKVTALNNAISGKVDLSTVNAVSDRVSTLEGYFSTAEDSDATINKWGEIVNFLDGVAEGSNVEQLLAAKANQSALNDLSTTVSNVDAKFANYLPTSGGTINGSIKIHNDAGDYNSVIEFSNASNYLGALGVSSYKRPTFYNGTSYEDILTTSGGMISGAVYINTSDTNPLQIFSSSGIQSGTIWYVNDTPKSWFGYDASGTNMYDYDHSATFGIASDGVPKFNNSPLWHSGNFNPSDYLSTSGGTIYGSLTVNSQLLIGADYLYDGAKTLIFRNASASADYGTQIVNSSTSSSTRFILNNDGVFFRDTTDKDNTLLHTGNYSNYALPLSGGQITGRLELYDRLCMGAQVIEMGKGMFGAFEDNENLYWYTPTSNTWNNLLHSGNVGDYAITPSTIGSQSVAYATTAGHATTCADARCVVADNNAVLPQGALLHSGINRLDDSTGDTWIYYDSLGGASAPWGIKHNQLDNYIEFYGAGVPNSFINLSTGDHYAKGFVNTDYWSAEYALTSNGGVAHIPSMSVNYANSAGSAPASDVYSWAKKSSLEASDVPDLSGSYLSTNGGILNGTLAINGYLNLKSHYIIANDNENAEWYVTDQGWRNAYTLIHSGNIGSQSVAEAQRLVSPYDYPNCVITNATTADSLFSAGYSFSAMQEDHPLFGYATIWNFSAYQNYGATQLAVAYNAETPRMTLRNYYQSTATWNAWREVAFLDSNVASADYAATAGSVAWDNVSGRPSVAIQNATNDFIHNSNEFTFVPSGYSGALWLNHKTVGGANGNITDYHFGDGKGGSLATISSGQFSGNAATATYATTAGTANSVAWDNVSGRPSSLPANGGTATNAINDGNDNNIANTYATKAEIPSIPSSLPANGGTATNAYNDQNGSNIVNTYATRDWVSSNFNYSTDSWRPIYDGVDSSATDTSASANAVRLAYGRADSAYNLAAGKQDAISDLSTIRSQASNGNTAYSWGNHASAGYLNTSSIVTDSGNPNVGSSAQPVEMMSFNGLITNGSVFSRNGSLYVADNPYMPVSTHWLDVYSDPQSYGGVFYKGQITLDLYPDRFYDVTHNPLISTLTINSISGWNNIGLISHNIVRFRPGSSAFTLTLPSGIYWANGNPIECDDPNSIYEISFIKRSGGDEITATWTKFTQA